MVSLMILMTHYQYAIMKYSKYLNCLPNVALFIWLYLYYDPFLTSLHIPYSPLIAQPNDIFFLFLVLIWQNKRPDMLALFGHFLLLIWHIVCTHLMQNVRCWLSPPPPVFLQINKSIIMFILKYWIRQKWFSLFTKCS